MSTRFRLVASDMDGTLLNAEHELSEFTKETLLRLAIEKNVIFVFATGRHYRALGNAERDLKAYFDNAYNALTHTNSKMMKHDESKISNNESTSTFTTSHNRQSVEVRQSEEMQESKTEEAATICTHPGFFLVTSNGARIHNPAGELIRSHDISSDLARVLYERYCIPFTHQKGFIDNPELMCKRFGMVPRVFPFDVNRKENDTRCVFDDFPVKGVGKFCFRCHNQQVLLEIEKDILAHFGDRLSVAFSGNYFLDVMTADVSKASAVEEVVRYVNEHGTYNNNSNNNNIIMSELNTCKQEGNLTNENKMKINSDGNSSDTLRWSLTTTTQEPITMHDVLAFGDSMNDASMIAAAGRGFIMQNGQTRLKQLLPQCEVIKSNEVDGVAQKLYEIFDLHEESAIPGNRVTKFYGFKNEHFVEK